MAEKMRPFTLRAGYAKLDITPGREHRLIGYAFRYEDLPPGNEGVHDPLHVRALVMQDASAQRLVLVSLELATLTTPVADTLREAIGEKLGVAVERVIVCCTHTHSGPFPVGPEADQSALAEDAVESEKGSRDEELGREYFEFLRERVVTAATMAAGKSVPVRLEYQQAPLGLGYVRRVMQGGELSHCWNPQEQEDLPVEPSCDPACAVAVLRQINGPRQYVLWNLGVHNLVLGKTSNVVSADFVGRACEIIEQLLPGADAMFLFGACGDVHPWIATQEDPANIEPVGVAAGAFVATLAQSTRAVESSGRDGEAIDGRISGAFGVATQGCHFGSMTFDLVAWRLGDVRLIAAPVELFSALGDRLRKRVAGPLLLVTEANGRTGYWPTEKAFEEGGYEVDIARNAGLAPGDSEKLAESMASLIASL